jgi:hypothetical protein
MDSCEGVSRSAARGKFGMAITRLGPDTSGLTIDAFIRKPQLLRRTPDKVSTKTLVKV